MHNKHRDKQTDCQYEVRIGHARVRVRGRSDEEALRHARNRLCLDMPRLWDVIQSMEINNFEIRRM
jgi:hypothetical protein